MRMYQCVSSSTSLISADMWEDNTLRNSLIKTQMSLTHARTHVHTQINEDDGTPNTTRHRRQRHPRRVACCECLCACMRAWECFGVWTCFQTPFISSDALLLFVTIRPDFMGQESVFLVYPTVFGVSNCFFPSCMRTPHQARALCACACTVYICITY